jgi:hypothetical protein
MNNLRPEDIEIYLAATPASEVLAWLAQRFPAHEPARPAGKRQWKQVLHYQGTDLPVLVIEGASPGFTSIWFNSPATPWASDRDCALEAFAHFQREVRATAGSWQEDADPDQWWCLSAAGESTIIWPA